MCALCHSWILAGPGEVAWHAQACSKQNRAGGGGGREAGAGVLFRFGSGGPGVAETRGPLLGSFAPDAAESHARHSCGSPYTRGPVGEPVLLLIHGQEEKGDGER